MGALSKVLRQAEGGRLLFWCPGCKHSHAIQTGDGPGPRWGWNGDAVRPVFTPSVLVRGIREDMDEATQAAYDALGPSELAGALDDPRFRTVCHSFVGCNGGAPGQIVYLSDCTHALAGQVVDMVEKWEC